MAYPPSYERDYSFTEFETLNPGQPKPGPALDAEFDDVSVALTATQDALALIQRDDGQLANNSVGEDQLQDTVFDGIVDGITADAEAARDAAIDAADAAAVFASSADTSADTASTQAGNAAGSAALAGTSQTIAQDAANEAAISAAAAATSAIDAETAANETAGSVAATEAAVEKAFQWAEYLAAPVEPAPGGYPEAVDDGMWSAKWWALRARDYNETNTLDFGAGGQADIGDAFEDWAAIPGNVLPIGQVYATWGTPTKTYVLTDHLNPEDPASWTNITGGPGPPNVLTIGTTLTGAPGSAAAASITGTSPAQVLNLTIPEGVQGIQGIQGIQGNAGPPNTLAIGTVTTGAPGSAADATITGFAPNQTLSMTLPRGDVGATGAAGATGATGPTGATGAPGAAGATGATGATGAAGPPNTLAIGTVTTGAAGSAASSTITGTAPNQTLNLTIPRGDTGAAGGGGTPGGSTSEIQFNNAGAFGGDPDLSWNASTNTMVVGSIATPGTVQGAQGTTTGVNLTLRGGPAGATGNGGQIRIQGGVPINGWGGNASVAAGDGVGTNQRGGNTIIAGGSSVGTSAAGGDVTLAGGNGSPTTGSGGEIFILGGAGGSTSGAGGPVTVQGGTAVDGNGGAVSILGRAGVGTNRSGGTVTLTAGASTGTSIGGGVVNITAGSGSPTTGPGGQVNITGGTAGGVQTGGLVTISGGTGGTTSGSGGPLQLQGGTATDGNGGAVSVLGRAGVGTNRAGGNVTISAGLSTGGAFGGVISITAGSGGPSGGGGGDVAINGGTGGTTSGPGGACTIKAGNAVGANAGGLITITAGNGGTTFGGGSITLTAGTAGTSSGAAGDVALVGGLASGGAAGVVKATTGNVLRLSILGNGTWELAGVPGAAGQALVSNGAGTPPTWQTAGAAAANPSAQIGLAAINGAATTFMRSDAAPALNQGIAPTWTANHTFSARALLANGAVGTPSLSFTSDTDSGMYSHAANLVGIAAGGATSAQFGPTAAYFNRMGDFGGLYAIDWNSNISALNYGTVSVVGNKGGYAGYAINDGLLYPLFMSSGGAVGLYIQADAKWLILRANSTTAQINFNLDANSFNATSSRAIKRETGKPSRAADILSRLRPIFYRLLKDEANEQLGLIAEEVHEICPQLSNGKTISYDRLAILLLADWQESRGLV